MAQLAVVAPGSVFDLDDDRRLRKQHADAGTNRNRRLLHVQEIQHLLQLPRHDLGKASSSRADCLIGSSPDQLILVAMIQPFDHAVTEPLDAANQDDENSNHGDHDGGLETLVAIADC